MPGCQIASYPEDQTCWYLISQGEQADGKQGPVPFSAVGEYSKGSNKKLKVQQETNKPLISCVYAKIAPKMGTDAHLKN